MRCRWPTAVACVLVGCGCGSIPFAASSQRDAVALDDASDPSFADAGPGPDAGHAPDASAPDATLAGDAGIQGPDASAPDAAPAPDAGAPTADASTPDASTPDAAAPDAGPGVGCGRFGLLADDFADGVASPTLWARRTIASGASVTESAGEVSVTLKANQNGSAYSFYGSTYQYDLTGSQVAVEVREVTNTSTTAATFLKLGDNDAGLELTTLSGNLDARTWVQGTLTTVGSTPYDPVAHARWRLREDGGTVFFETSPDGVTWTALASVTTPSFVQRAWMSFGAGTFQRVASPGRARFGPVNGGVPSGRGCAALTDAFTGSTVGAAWFNSYALGGAAYSQSDSAILVPGTSAPAEAGFGSAHVYDLTAGSVSVAVPEMVSTSVPGPWVAFTLVDPGRGGKIEFTQSGGTLFAKHWVDGTAKNLASVSYDPAAHGAWRLREAAGQVLWETRGAATDWKVLFSEAAPFPVSALGVYLIAGSDSATSAAGRARFDDLNLVP